MGLYLEIRILKEKFRYPLATVGWFLPRIGMLYAPYYTERINYVLEVYRWNTLSHTHKGAAA